MRAGHGRSVHGFLKFVVWLLVSLATANTAAESIKAGETEMEMESELSTLLAGGIEGSPELAGLQVLVIRGGDVVFEYAGGYARLDEDEAVKMNLDHKPRIASISKLVAAIGLMRLVEAGRVDLDSDVSGHLGFTLRNPAWPQAPITLRMVLSHTSSIRDGSYYWLEAGQGFEDFFRPGAPHWEDGAHFAQAPGQEPGKHFTYANLNFGVVAAVIERVSGRRFDRYMRGEVLEPLGLQASYNVCDLSEKYPERIATLYRKRDENEVWRPEEDWVPQLDDARFSCHYGREPVGRGEAPGPVLPEYVPGQNPTLFSPQGGLRASARDLAVVAGLLMNQGRHEDTRVLDPGWIDTMLEPQWVFDPKAGNGHPGEGPDTQARRLFSAFGLSVHIVDTAQWEIGEDERVLYGHLGEAYGLIGQFWVDPANNDALISLITGSADDPDRYPGSTPLYRPSEEIMRWWNRHFPR